MQYLKKVEVLRLKSVCSVMLPNSTLPHLPLVTQSEGPAPDSSHWLYHCCCEGCLGFSNKQSNILKTPRNNSVYTFWGNQPLAQPFGEHFAVISFAYTICHRHLPGDKCGLACVASRPIPLPVHKNKITRSP